MAAVGSLFERMAHWSQLQLTLDKHKISITDIVKLSGIDRGQVCRVLNKGSFATVKHSTVLRVRDAALKLLPDEITDEERMKMLAEYDREVL